MNLTRFLAIGWAATAVLLVFAWMRSGTSPPAEATSNPPSPLVTVDAPEPAPQGYVRRAEVGRQPPEQSTAVAEPPFTESEYYKKALARVLLPELTGNPDVDRRNGLRHRLRSSGLYDPDSFTGQNWTATQIRNNQKINPDGIDLSDEQVEDIARLLAGDLDERRALWQHRLALEGAALESAIAAGAIDWFGPTAPHQDPSLNADQQQIEFQKHMNSTWGPMGLRWTCMITDVRGEPCVVYVTPQTAPELFEAISACVEQERAGLEAASRYVATLPR